MWFIFSVAGYLLLAVVFILDKKILTKSVARPIVYTFYSTIFLLLLFLLWPFTSGHVNFFGALIGLISGLMLGLGLWMLFLAVKAGEATHIDPFVGGVTIIATYAVSGAFLEESLSSAQIAGVLLIALACLLLSFETSRSHHGWHMGFVWAIIAGVCFALSAVTAKYLYEQYSFWNALMWSKGTGGFFALFLLLSPTVRSALARTNDSARQSARSLVVTDKFLGIIGVLFIQYATALGSVTLVNALVGIQYVTMFILVYLFTLRSPTLFKEYFTRREFIMEMAALLAIGLGSALFVL